MSQFVCWTLLGWSAPSRMKCVPVYRLWLHVHVLEHSQSLSTHCTSWHKVGAARVHGGQVHHRADNIKTANVHTLTFTPAVTGRTWRLNLKKAQELNLEPSCQPLLSARVVQMQRKCSAWWWYSGCSSTGAALCLWPFVCFLVNILPLKRRTKNQAVYKMLCTQPCEHSKDLHDTQHWWQGQQDRNLF